MSLMPRGRCHQGLPRRRRDFTPAAKRQLAELRENGFGNLPVCVAKTQYSFSDNAKVLGAPENFRITVRELKVSAGAHFVVALTGSVLTMPGLPRCPRPKTSTSTTTATSPACSKPAVHSC